MDFIKNAKTFVHVMGDFQHMTKRRGLVKKLRVFARTHNVTQVRDEAGKDKVLQMVGAVRAKALGRDDWNNLEVAVQGYLQSFQDAGRW